jgi:hypothetical protein
MLVLAGCGGTAGNNQGDIVEFRAGEPIRVTLKCADQETTLFSDIDGVGPRGVSVRGMNKILQVGDEITREADCNGKELNVTIGKIVEVTNTFRVKIEIYDPVKIN